MLDLFGTGVDPGPGGESGRQVLVGVFLCLIGLPLAGIGLLAGLLACGYWRAAFPGCALRRGCGAALAVGETVIFLASSFHQY